MTLLGVTGSGKTFTMAHTVARLQRPTLVVSPNKTLAAQLVSEFRALFPTSAVEYFVSYYDYYQPEAYVPQIDLYIEKDAAINEEIDRLRHRATQALLTRRDVLVVASVSCIYGLGSPEDYAASVVSLRVGQEIGRQALLEQLIRMKYTRNDVELRRGRFRVRGGHNRRDGGGRGRPSDRPRGEDAQRDRGARPGDEGGAPGASRARDLPRDPFPDGGRAAEGDPGRDREGAGRTRRGAEGRGEDRGSPAAQRPRQLRPRDDPRDRLLLGDRELRPVLLRRKPGEPPYTLLDFFPEDFLVFMDESHVGVPQLQGMFKGDRSRKDNLVEFGWRLPSCRDNRPLKFDEFLAHVPQVVFVSATPGPYERRVSKGIVEQIIRPTGLVDPPVEVRPLKGHIADLVTELRACIARGDRALVTTLTKRTSEELTRYLTNLGLKVRYLHSDVETLKRVEVLRDLRLGRFDALVGINLLREGLDLPEVSFVAVLDADKEGFLRSETSIVQTAGRASRNLSGRVVLYADRVTGSMRRAIAEMSRRRTAQIEYNEEHGIVPETIRKEVRSILAPEEAAPSGDLSVENLGKKWKERLPLLLANLEEEMRLAAERLEFEEAARIRDRIHEIRRQAKTPREGRPAGTAAA